MSIGQSLLWIISCHLDDGPEAIGTPTLWSHSQRLIKIQTRLIHPTYR